MTGDPAVPEPGAASGRRRVRSISYEHDSDMYEVTVGRPRKVYPRQTGSRGGYIKDAGFRRWAARQARL
jgi:hypothetical protein